MIIKNTKKTKKKTQHSYFTFLSPCLGHMGRYPGFIWVVLTLRRKKGRKERNRNTWVSQPKLSPSSRLPPTPNQPQTPRECYLYQKADIHQHRSILWVHHSCFSNFKSHQGTTLKYSFWLSRSGVDPKLCLISSQVMLLLLLMLMLLAGLLATHFVARPGKISSESDC